jgi:hypothetical protein
MLCYLVAAFTLQMKHVTAGKAVKMKMAVAILVRPNVLIDGTVAVSGREFGHLALVAKRGEHAVDRAAPRGVGIVGGAEKAKAGIDLLRAFGWLGGDLPQIGRKTGAPCGVIVLFFHGNLLKMRIIFKL